MKKKVHPLIVGVTLALVFAALVYNGFKVATEKPVYIGLRAPNAARPNRTDIEITPKTPPKNAKEARNMGIPASIPIRP